MRSYNVSPLYGIVSAKRDLTHIFSRFHIFGYSRSLHIAQVLIRTEN